MLSNSYKLNASILSRSLLLSNWMFRQNWKQDPWVHEKWKEWRAVSQALNTER